jgi:RecA/RadA recombinase
MTQCISFTQAWRNKTSYSTNKAPYVYRLSPSFLCLTSGSEAVDRLLDGGLETQTIPEFCGEYGTGKVRFAISHA